MRDNLGFGIFGNEDRERLFLNGVGYLEYNLVVRC